MVVLYSIPYTPWSIPYAVCISRGLLVVSYQSLRECTYLYASLSWTGQLNVPVVLAEGTSVRTAGRHTAPLLLGNPFRPFVVPAIRLVFVDLVRNTSTGTRRHYRVSVCSMYSVVDVYRQTQKSNCSIPAGKQDHDHPSHMYRSTTRQSVSIHPSTPLCNKTKTKKKKTRGVSTNKPGRLALIPAVCLGLYVPSGNSRSGYLDR